MRSPQQAADAVKLIDQFLEEDLKNKGQRWCDTYMYLQYKRRKDLEQGEQNAVPFTIEDHLRAMVYSMLSSNVPWSKISKCVDSDSKRLTEVDEIFFGYCPTLLKKVALAFWLPHLRTRDTVVGVGASRCAPW